MKDGLEPQSKSTNFHWILHLNAVRNHSDTLPVIFGKRCVIVGIESWTLFKCIKSSCDFTVVDESDVFLSNITSNVYNKIHHSSKMFLRLFLSGRETWLLDIINCHTRYEVNLIVCSAGFSSYIWSSFRPNATLHDI